MFSTSSLVNDGQKHRFDKCCPLHHLQYMYKRCRLQKAFALELILLCFDCNFHLDLLLCEAVTLVAKLVQVEAVGVVACEAAQEGVAVLGGAEGSTHVAALQPEAINRLDGRPRILLCSKWRQEGGCRSLMLRRNA